MRQNVELLRVENLLIFFLLKKIEKNAFIKSPGDKKRLKWWYLEWRFGAKNKKNNKNKNCQKNSHVIRINKKLLIIMFFMYDTFVTNRHRNMLQNLWQFLFVIDRLHFWFLFIWLPLFFSCLWGSFFFFFLLYIFFYVCCCHCRKSKQSKIH